MSRLPLHELAQLEALRGASPLVYCVSEQWPKKLTTPDVHAFSRAWQELPRGKSVDLIIHTEGGMVAAARSFALQLRQHASRLEVLVPYKARSAGTLLCLAADAIILGPVAEFSPIDPLIRSGGEASSSLPKWISSQDIRAFRAMADQWFELRSEESRLKVLDILSQRLFPPALGAFFRADQFVRKVARELIAYQLPEATDAVKAGIVDQLVEGYPTHNDPINRHEILHLGLRARAASDPEERLMAAIQGECQSYMASTAESGTKGRVRALFFGRGFGLRFVDFRRADVASSADDEEAAGGDASRRWQEIDIRRDA